MNIGIRADGMTPSAFEDFAIEIVKKKFDNNSLHGFTQGRDDGIDGIDDIKKPTLIIQAKRWQINRSHTTAVKLLKNEIDKIAQTKVKYGWNTDFKYVIVTSMGLSPGGLKEIRDYADKIIPNAIPTDDYIIHSSILTTLSQSQKYRCIFEKFGLIVQDISTILKKDRLKNVEEQSRDYFSNFDFKYFVETSFLGEAYHILQNEHILLIQGPAGIGKTTTCSMLGNLFLSNNQNSFDIIVRRVEDIDEVLDLYNSNYRYTENKNLFVVFDDFLGRNKFDVGERMLKDIMKLYSASTNSNNLYICLNSRTQILQAAKSTTSEFQRLIDEKFTVKRNFIIDLSKYSIKDRAYIFRKIFEQRLHCLENEDRVEIMEKYNSLIGKDWTKIIQHKNYFPRLIELIAKNFKNSKDDFYNYVVYYLNHPVQLYNNLFYNLENEEKYLLFSLLQFDRYPIEEEWLRNSLYALKLSTTFDFGKSFEKLDGSWLSFTRETFDAKNMVDFFNPSIIDFLNEKVKEHPNLVKDLSQNSVYLHQLCKDCYFEDERNIFFRRLLTDWDNFKDKNDFIGEKILAIFHLEELSKYKNNFSELLMSYDGRINFPLYNKGWEEVITQIYFCDDNEIKEIFLHILDDESVVYNESVVYKIVNSLNFDSDALDNVMWLINNIIEEVSVECENYKKSSIRNMSCYPIFRESKIVFIQYYLNGEYTLEDEDIDFYNDPNGFDIDEQVNLQMEGFYEKVLCKLNSLYIWDDINGVDFDYSVLAGNLYEYLQNKYDAYLYEDGLHEIAVESLREETYMVNEILDKPLADENI